MDTTSEQLPAQPKGPAIISASRRTDIPAFYAQWFVRRLRAGYCTVPNPFNRQQVSRISLDPADVAVIVFWTRNPRPLFPHLAELDRRGYRYYFQYTLLGYPPPLDPFSPRLEAALHTFKELSRRIGPQRVIWRYDPLALTRVTPLEYHLRNYEAIAHALQGYTHRCVISLLDQYAKANKRMQQVARSGAPLLDLPVDSPQVGELLREMAQVARSSGMQITSCAEEIALQPYGICPGKCIDDNLVRDVFGLDVTHRKDPGQRSACGCVVSRDIGMYDSCLFGCPYCYATSSFERARIHYARHDPDGESLL